MLGETNAKCRHLVVIGVVGTSEAEDDILVAIRGTDLTDQSKTIIKITNAANVPHEGTGVEKETDQREETETKDQTTDLMSCAREFASAVIAGDT